MKTFVSKLGLVLALFLNERGVSEAIGQTSDADGAVEGIITFKGEVPKSSISDDAGAQRDLLQVDKASRGLANVVVWLIGQDSELKKRTSPAPLAPAFMDQRDHEFVPRVIAVEAGQPVKFSNSDPANHNVRTISGRKTNEFNVFTGLDGSYTHSFVVEAEQRPVQVSCDIHPWMRGWIYVDHPWFAVTDEGGRFRIRSVPAGKYRLAVRQPDIRYRGNEFIIVSNKQPTKVQIEISAQDRNGER